MQGNLSLSFTTTTSGMIGGVSKAVSEHLTIATIFKRLLLIQPYEKSNPKSNRNERFTGSWDYWFGFVLRFTGDAGKEVGDNSIVRALNPRIVKTDNNGLVVRFDMAVDNPTNTSVRLSKPVITLSRSGWQDSNFLCLFNTIF